jgi:Na+/citrate or Na+/malate symporter
VKPFDAFMKDSGTTFLAVFIGSLIPGAIPGIHSKMLLKVGVEPELVCQTIRGGLAGTMMKAKEPPGRLRSQRAGAPL